MKTATRLRYCTFALGILILGYAAAYRFLPKHYSAKVSNGEHMNYRVFPYEWEGKVFWPTAWLEFKVMQTFPKLFSSNPTDTAEFQILFLQTPKHNYTFSTHSSGDGTDRDLMAPEYVRDGKGNPLKIIRTFTNKTKFSTPK